MKSLKFYNCWSKTNNFTTITTPSLVDYSDDEDDNDSDDNDFIPTVEINISEIIDNNDYALFMWDSSIVLSWYLFSFLKDNGSNYWNNKIVLELNAGVALPSILLSKLGSQVIITDRFDDGWNEIKNNILNSLSSNNNNNNNNSSNRPIIEPLSWGGNFDNISNYLNTTPIDYLISSDCFYDNSKNYDEIFSTWFYFLMKNPNLKIIVTYQVRCNEKSISNYLKKWGLESKIINIQDILPPTTDLNIKNEIILFQISKNN